MPVKTVSASTTGKAPSSIFLPIVSNFAIFVRLYVSMFGQIDPPHIHLLKSILVYSQFSLPFV